MANTKSPSVIGYISDKDPYIAEPFMSGDEALRSITLSLEKMAGIEGNPDIISMDICRRRMAVAAATYARTIDASFPNVPADVVDIMSADETLRIVAAAVKAIADAE